MSLRAVRLHWHFGSVCVGKRLNRLDSFISVITLKAGVCPATTVRNAVTLCRFWWVDTSVKVCRSDFQPARAHAYGCEGVYLA